MLVKEDKLLLGGIPKFYGIRQVPLQYTSIGYDGKCLVIGTDAGVIVCYNEENDTSFRIPPQGYSKIECIEVRKGVLTWGTDTGYVGIRDYLSEHQHKQLLKKVHDVCVEYVCYYGNKIASVGNDGVIMFSDVNWTKGVISCCSVLHSEPHKVLSLFFLSTELLLLTTVLKTVFLKIEDDACLVIPVGSKERKSGEFGACVLDEFSVLVARPGLRLWYANTSGAVLKTLQLKNVLKECQIECSDGNEGTTLGKFLPKSGIINRVERIEEKLVVIQLRDLFVFVETIDLTVVGWLREQCLDWYACHRTIILLFPENLVKRYIVTGDPSLAPSQSVDNIATESSHDFPAFGSNGEPIPVLEDRTSNPENDRPHILQRLNDSSPHDQYEMVETSSQYKPVSQAKIDEISNFVKTICERGTNESDVSNQATLPLDTLQNEIITNDNTLDKHSNYTVVPSKEHSISSIEDVKFSIDVSQSTNDSIQMHSKVIQPSNSSHNEPVVTYYENNSKIDEVQSDNDNRDFSSREIEDLSNNCEDTLTLNDNTINQHSQNVVADSCDVTKSQNDVTLSNNEAPPPENNVPLQQNHVEPPLNDVTALQNDATVTKNDTTQPENGVIQPENGVMLPQNDPTITITAAGMNDEESSENLEMSIADSSNVFSSEKSVMEELKSNLGKKMITSLGLTPSPHKHKQLITSDTTLPLFEPDKISLSSQDTISLHSSSTNCEDDEDRIATRIRRKKRKCRKDVTSSPETHDSGVISQETREDSLQETIKSASPDFTMSVGAFSPDIRDTDNLVESVESETNSEQPDTVIGLDVSSILTGLANIEEGVLKLDDLGLPVLQFDDPYDGEEEEHEEEEEEENKEEEIAGIVGVENDKEIKEDTDIGDRNSPLLTSSSSTIVNGATSTDNIENIDNIENSFISEVRMNRSKTVPSSRNDVEVYPTRTFSESTSDLYDLERRPSIEVGEYPLTSEMGVDPLMRGTTSSSPSDTSVFTPPSTRHSKSRGKDDSVFLTDDSWLELRGPTMSKMYVTISCLAVSSVSVWCTDNWGNVYFSLNTRGRSLKWEKVQGSKLASLSVSDSGLIVWGVTTNKRAVVRFGIDNNQLQGSDWSEMMLEAVTVAVDETSVWLLVSGGKYRLYFRDGVTAEDPQGEKWLPVSTQNLNITSLSVNSSVVWGVLDSGKLVIRHGISSSQPLGNSWHVLSVNNVKCCHVGRNWEVGWVVDSAGIVHFQCGVLPAKPRGSNLWWQVSVSEQLGSNFVANTVGLFTSRRRTLDVKQVYTSTEDLVWLLSNYNTLTVAYPQVCTSTEGGVWLLSNYNTLHRRYGIITGHNWANISRMLVSGRREQWHTLAGEGAYPDISGPVWGLTMSGEIVCFTRSSPPRPLESPCSQGRVVNIAATTNVLWAVDQSGQIHVRAGLARDNVTGTHWQSLNMAQMFGVLLHKLSCSDRGVWAVDNTGTAWFRTGCAAGSDTVQAWIKVESDPPNLKFREVSAAGSLVWAVDVRNSVYVRTGVSYSLPVGNSWEHVPGLQCVHVRAAQEGVVALSTSQSLVYRHGTCPTLPAGNYWRKVPGPPPDGSVSLITTLKGGGVWCQSGRSNLLYRRRVKTIPDCVHVTEHVGAEPAEDGWEVV